MLIHTYLVPYNSGRRDWRMGNGPGRFLHNGLEDSLRARGHTLQASVIESQDPFPSEIKTAFELYGRLAGEVRAGCQAGAFPLVLSGNCSAALGTLAGLPAEPVGIVWLDAHGDFNTPETSASGYLDGMGLAVAAGQCWVKLASAIPHFRPTAGRRILHLGGRDVEPEEEGLMRTAQVKLVPAGSLQAEGVRAALSPALEALREEVRDVYLHFDLDVLDARKTPANHFPAPGGLEVETVVEAVRLIREQFTVRALGVASYDPSCDSHGNTLRAGMELIGAAIGTIG